MKTFLTLSVIAVLLLGGAVWFSRTIQTNDTGIISTNGLHWHPELEIYVNGEKQEVPQNIGLTGVHQPMHTHDDLPIIHLEFQGVVKKDDVILGQFFKNWGKDMSSFGANMKMTVNGIENTELENYVMQDKDKIVLHYE